MLNRNSSAGTAAPQSSKCSLMQRPAIILAMLLLCAVLSTQAQTKNYIDRDVCIASEVHKGKVNHGKSYCVRWATVREYKDGKKDTVSWTYSGKIQWGDEIGKYDKLSERGKYIVDSLKEDGIAQLHDAYLTYEPIYMKAGKKTEWLWRIEGEAVMMYQYSFWNNSKGSGIQLLKEAAVK